MCTIQTRNQFLVTTAKINSGVTDQVFFQNTFFRKFQGRSMSPTLYTKKSMSNAKYLSRSVKCGQVPTWVICTCAETIERMWFWPRNVPKLICWLRQSFISISHVVLEFSVKELMRVVRQKYGSPTSSHFFTSPVHTHPHPLYARGVNSGSPS